MRFPTPGLAVYLLAASLCAVSLSLTAAPAKARKPAEYKLSGPDKAWVAKTMKRLSLHDRIAQLIQVRVQGKFLNRNSPDFLKIKEEVQRNHVGGVVLFAGNVYESALLLNELQSLSKLPLVVSADFERGASFRISDTTSFPWTMAIGAAGSEELAYTEGAITAQEARALGVHWIFAPVMDVNNNPDNPVINIRSYGEDPQLVARLGAAFIRGAHDKGVLTTAKHFPGHGDTATDTHIGLAVIPSDLARLNSIEFVPFRSAIAAGVDSIMTAHIAVPKVTDDSGLPATLSHKILTGLLRDLLHFQGLIATDALEMGGITSRFWGGLAAVRAVQAGADVLLLPSDTNVAISEIERAVRRGDISEELINRSVEKMLSAKTRLGLHLNRTVAINRIGDLVDAPENRHAAETMADRSITLLRDDRHLLPIDPRHAPKIYSVVLSSDLEPSPGAVFQAELRRRFLTARTASADPRMPDELASNIVKAAAESDVIVLSTLVRVISGKGNVALPDNQKRLVENLLAAGRPVIWLSFGNPYVLGLFPQIQTYLCTFSYSDVSQVAAAKALAGDIPISGKMPVSIPGQSKVGDGLQVPMLDMTLNQVAPPQLGLPDSAFEETKKLLAGFVETKAFPGASLVVGYRGSIVLSDGEGRLDYSAASGKVTENTIYDLASVSKAVGTTTAA
ncbi:MAG TPA: glycoside hydrolase family 3 N-terminal domain-containing protein, partial [Acidobacteriota bacterium]|nr:glycoside hydrolase family 3 N-terminal domain-containing protein [Acidobacteriota bacterium]